MSDQTFKLQFVAIVDDDASVRKAVARLLRAHGVDVRTYGSAREFLEALPSGIPDCLIVDLNMPDASGLELQRELLRLNARIPTVVMTGCDEKTNRHQCCDLGATAYLLKPMDKDELMAAIGSAAKPN
jgi:FixJ family two-component response regulator